MAGFVGMWYSKEQIHIADSFIGYLLSNPTFQTVFNIEERGID